MARFRFLGRFVATCARAPSTPHVAISSRSFSTSRTQFPFNCTTAEYQTHGDVRKVTELHTSELPAPQGAEVVIEMLAAPINPADFNMIQGNYSLLPPLPAVGGNEGVARVSHLGDDVKHLQIGDHVIPLNAGLGTWRTHAVVCEDELVRVDQTLPIAKAATLSVNPCTAYRMLMYFVDLTPGDVVLQNCANSGVGEAVIQFARARGIKTINVVRDRPDIDDLRTWLRRLGADELVTEEEASARDFGALVKEISGGAGARLGLNAVGGRSSATVARGLCNGGTMVTYGGMSMKPVTIPTSLFIFKDIRLRGFWMTRWNSGATRAEREQMLATVASLVSSPKFELSLEPFPFADLPSALDRAHERRRHGKVLLEF